MQNIILGPMLGVESDTKYSVCILLNKEVKKPSLFVSVLVDLVNVECKELLLDQYFFYRFSFELPHSFSGEFTYKVIWNDEFLKAQNGFYYWTVDICDQNVVPDLAFVSCNGRDDIPAKCIREEDYVGWKQLKNQKPHYLFLTGDQVYTDNIFQAIPDLALKLKEVDDALLERIEVFFLELYIHSWQNYHLALALATIPNVMSWDDHDILDGYGSFNGSIQSVLKPIYKIARKYYLLFQLRSKANVSLKSSPGLQDLNQILMLRNYILIMPDTRTCRTQNRVLEDRQYAFLNTYKEKLQLVAKKYSLIFVLPVPIAHLNFFGFAERILDFRDSKKGSNFNTFDSDDAIDHWDHRFHKAEQKEMLDLMFDYGTTLEVKHLIIVSGDVHSAGASTVFKMNDTPNAATQLITSPIVNKPAPWYIRFSGTRFKLIHDYGCDLKNFGSSRNRMFNQRNFMLLKMDPRGLKAHLFLAQDGTWEKASKQYRTINKFKGGLAKLHWRLKLKKAIRDFLSLNLRL
jgi:hypothetical protein